jgi:VWFA-related protein
MLQGGTQQASEANSTVATAPGQNGAPSASPASSETQRYIAVVFDVLNLSSSELAAAQQAASKLIEISMGSSDTAAVLATSGTNSGLTRDRTKLQEAIQKLKTQNTYLPSLHDCPNLDYYQADLIQDQGNGPAYDAAVSDAMICAGLPKGAEKAAMTMVRETASRVVNMMEANFRANLAFLRLVITRMEALPGKHIVIFISPGFLTPTPEAMRLKSELVDNASQANVTINAVDARGLYTANLEASGKGENPGAAPLKTEFRQTSALAQENVMAELADGTGGVYLRHTNRMDFSSLFAGPRYLYVLSYSPAKVKADGSYHILKVNVMQRGFKVQARRGYFAPKPQKK